MDNFPDEDKRWYMRVGYLAECWASVERTLDGVVHVLHNNYGGKEIEPHPPQAFKRKVTYTRKIFANHPDLNRSSESAAKILAEAERLADIRHWALHGNRINDGPNDVVTLARLSRKSKPAKHEEHLLSHDEVYQAAIDSASLTLTLFVFSNIAFGFKSKDEMAEVLSEIARQTGAPFPLDDSAG